MVTPERRARACRLWNPAPELGRLPARPRMASPAGATSLCPFAALTRALRLCWAGPLGLGVLLRGGALGGVAGVRVTRLQLKGVEPLEGGGLQARRPRLAVQRAADNTRLGQLLPGASKQLRRRHRRGRLGPEGVGLGPVRTRPPPERELAKRLAERRARRPNGGCGQTVVASVPAAPARSSARSIARQCPWCSADGFAQCGSQT